MSNLSEESIITAKDLNLVSCHICNRLATVEQEHCNRCLAPLHLRKPACVQRCWALLVTAAMLYVLAMLFPVSTIYTLEKHQASTLMGSVIHFLEEGAWPIAMVIFVASVLVPLLKIFGLSYLLISIQLKSGKYKLQRTKFYRIVEFVGRWSMIDVFVVATLVALVQFGVFINIIPGFGILAFASVVVLTMLASSFFDPRLIWDKSD